MKWCTASQGGIYLDIRVVPRSSTNRIAELSDDALRVAITAPPVDGKANKALVRFLAGVLGVKRSQIEIVAGQSSRTKRLFVAGIHVPHALKALAAN